VSADPRLRLLGDQATSDVADAVLRRLDETAVVVAVSPDADRAARGAVAAFIVMIARLVPNVTVDSASSLPANWWRATSWDDLLGRLDSVRPHTNAPATRQVTVGFGVLDDGCDLYVGGGDWNVLLSDAPVGLEDGNDHALGVHAAGCMAVSQVLIKVLADVGFPGVAVAGRVETNLVDHGLHTVDPHEICELVGDETVRLLAGFLGVGSVGTSALALLATACSPVLNPGSRLAEVLEATAVDRDVFDPGRNPYRYPALLGGETEKKARAMADRLNELGITADAVGSEVATWNMSKPEPGWRGVLISSVDTIPGRLDVADVLGERTLSAGVSGTELHVQWERFADGYECPFCDFVRADPPLTQAGVFAEVTGIPVSRVLALLQDGAVMDASEVDMAIAGGRVPAHRREVLVGAPLSDLVRQAYAEAEVRPQGASPSADVVAVASPQVSWFAGALIVAELVKYMLGLPTLQRRVDLDVAGLPAGVVRSVPAESSGTCVCRSGVRARWYRELYHAPSTSSSSTTESGRQPCRVHRS
jgi:hypothetical protein